ncbi:polysaccharide deacetylase family protein [Pseudorhodoferax sp.]|uniref:polysaccharide deacetylase family protein n=1 Tax=Pseudorhodoferax sp. TaxID=1993553 RepID=UPI0039E25E10
MLSPLFNMLSHGKLSVLLFHKVPLQVDPLVPHEPDLATVQGVLEAVGRLFRVLPLADAVVALRAGTLPRRAACITFDDGYQDWVPGVMPVLQRLGMHATFFVTTGQFQGVPVWSERIVHAVRQANVAMTILDLERPGLRDLPMQGPVARSQTVARVGAKLKYMRLSEREEALQHLESLCGVMCQTTPVMPVADLRALHAAGFGIGAHTISHPILRRCDSQEAYREIAASREDLEGLVGGRVDGFAYPNGQFGRDLDVSHVDMVRRAGYRYAVTTDWGVARAGQSVFQLPRFTPWGPSFAKMAWQFARNMLRSPRVLPETRTHATRRALMVAFHFPPQSGSSGVLRTLNFVKHLPRSAWQADVLTAQPRAYEQVRTDLVEEVPPSVEIVRAMALDTARQLSLYGKYPLTLALPDRWSSWWLPAVWAGWRQLRQGRVDLLWSTYPIATAHLIGVTLARCSAVPWVADFRDPMLNGDHPREPLKRRLWQRLEQSVMRHAALCVFTTERAAAAHRQRYPAFAHKCVVIENGYDEESFVPLRPMRLGAAQNKLLLLHSGLIYPGDRDPSAFFAALAALLRAGVVPRDGVVARFRAPVHSDEVMRLAHQHGVGDVVECTGQLAHAQALSEMLGADLLLLFQGTTFNAQVPAKVYEYLRAQRPILAAVDPQGDTAALVRSFDHAWLADITSTEEIEGALVQWLASRSELQHAAPFAANLERLARYSRREQAKRLAQHLDQLVRNRN